MTAGMLRPLALPLLVAVLARGQLTVPEIGYLADPSGGLRAVRGIGGNFLLGGVVARDVRAAAFTDGLGLIHTSGRLVLVGKDLEVVDTLPVEESEALVAVASSPPRGVAWLPEAGQICRLEPDAGKTAPCFSLELDGAVEGIGLSGASSAAIIVRRLDARWLVVADLDRRCITRESLLAGVAAPLILIGEDLLYYRDGRLVLRRADGSEISAGSPVAVSLLRQVGDGWVALSGGEGNGLGIARVRETGIDTFRLPGGEP